MHYLKKYKGKKVAVMYSAGFDSGFMAHHLLHTIGAEEVALIMFDCGRENDPQSQFFDPTRTVDTIKDIWQYERYANILQRHRKTSNTYKLWTMRSPELRSLTVEPSNLAPDTNPLTRFEEGRTLTFYAGFVMNYFTQALSVASKYGYDYVLTGHMGWNEHYEDESQQFAQDVNRLFETYYGPRLLVCPKVEMPYRDNNVTKEQLIRDNSLSEIPLDTRDSISCNVSKLDYAHGQAVDFELKEGYQIHCGKCLHCEDRKRAFAEAGVRDEAYYAD